jgi:hypothetical protein
VQWLCEGCGHGRLVFRPDCGNADLFR